MKSSSRKVLVGGISIISALRSKSGQVQGLDSTIGEKLAMHHGRGGTL